MGKFDHIINKANIFYKLAVKWYDVKLSPITPDGPAIESEHGKEWWRKEPSPITPDDPAIEHLIPWSGLDIKHHERNYYNNLEYNQQKMIRSLPKHQRLPFLRTLMDAEAHDESNAKDHKRCNCEQSRCEREGKHRAGDCKRHAGDKRAKYIGAICDECAKTMPEEYMLPDSK